MKTHDVRNTPHDVRAPLENFQSPSVNSLLFLARLGSACSGSDSVVPSAPSTGQSEHKLAVSDSQTSARALSVSDPSNKVEFTGSAIVGGTFTVHLGPRRHQSSAWRAPCPCVCNLGKPVTGNQRIRCRLSLETRRRRCRPQRHQWPIMSGWFTATILEIQGIQHACWWRTTCGRMGQTHSLSRTISDSHWPCMHRLKSRHHGHGVNVADVSWGLADLGLTSTWHCESGLGLGETPHPLVALAARIARWLGLFCQEG